MEVLFYRQRGGDSEELAAAVLPATAESAEAPPMAAAGSDGGRSRPILVADGGTSAVGEVRSAPAQLEVAKHPSSPARIDGTILSLTCPGLSPLLPHIAAACRRLCCCSDPPLIAFHNG